MEKAEIKFECYSNCAAVVFVTLYWFIGVLLRLPVPEIPFWVSVEQSMISLLAVYLLSLGTQQGGNEGTYQVGYILCLLGSLSVFGYSPISVLYLPTNIAILFLYAYNDKQDLPLTNKAPTSLLYHICSHVDSRRISLFLLYCVFSINLMFMFVEAAYGYWSNSLGLISDAIHMCFDCIALAIGLYASYISKSPPDSNHPYGYSRYEVLSGYVNAVFLVFVGLNILVESLERILEPPEIQSEMLLLVSVLGLLVNLVGIFFFHEFSMSDGNSNLQGVFLHILADALGSVGVIISSVLVMNWQWYISDPICSLIISALILVSVVPLLENSTKVLLERDMQGKAKKWKGVLSEVEGVKEVQKMHVWTVSGEQNAMMVWVLAEPEADSLKLVKECKQLIPVQSSVQILK